MVPLFNPFQLAWVTNDLERSMALFRDEYGVPEFMVIESRFPAVVQGQTGEMFLGIALANVDDKQFELIQPMGGGVDFIYRDVLPADGSFANVFHHVCILIEGPLENWDRHVANLRQSQPICYTGDPGDQVRFMYTDDRPTLGHYVEHVWYTEEGAAQLKAAIPHHVSPAWVREHG